jgi:S1-C subfamily serine protease
MKSRREKRRLWRFALIGMRDFASKSQLNLGRETPKEGQMRVFSGAFVVAAFVAIQTVTSFALTIPEIVARSKPAVIDIIAPRQGGSGAQGTGFFISADGWAVTNHHVVRGAYVVGAKTATGKTYISQRILFPRDDTDVAFVKFAVTGVPYLEPGNVNQLAQGERIIVIGNPGGGAEGSASEGIISAFLDGRDKIQITAPISPGSSGSPVLNEDGKVIGIVKATSAREWTQNLNFAVSMKAIENALKGGLASSEPSSHSLPEIPSEPQPPSHGSPPSAGLGPPVTTLADIVRGTIINDDDPYIVRAENGTLYKVELSSGDSDWSEGDHVVLSNTYGLGKMISQDYEKAADVDVDEIEND